MAQSNSLKALIQRLTSTPVEDLPNIAYFLASSISASINFPQNPGSDRATLLHKLKARISSLLQERTPEGRLAAVIVAKAVIEAGGREILVDSEPWLRGLIGILNKSDPVATKRLAILTVSRAFVLTQDYPTVVREVTTPLLPAFNTACLAVIRPRSTRSDKGTQNILSPLLPTALQCWSELLPQHPATFRPFVTRFRPICLSLLSDATTSDSISRSAGALLVALHHSAPKNTAISEWSQFCGDTIRAAHTTADSLFRSLREDWVPAEPGFVQAVDSSRLNGEQPGGGPDVLGLAGWKGMHSGMQRLSRLVRLLEASVSAATATEVPIPLSSIIDLSARLLALTIPGTSKDSPYTLRSNADFGKDEREMLASEIPSIHADCLRLLSVVVETLQYAILPISKSVIDQLTWLFDAEHDLPEIRAASYDLVDLLLPVVGPASTDADVKQLSGIIRHACREVLFTPTMIDTQTGNEKGIKAAVTNIDSFAGPTKQSVDQKVWPKHSALQRKAASLISMFLQCVPAHLIPNTQRIEIDRTVVLTQDKRALLASVLNPATANQGQHAPASLLPFLAHRDSGPEAESLLRPRMAVIVDKQADGMDHETADSESGRSIVNKDSSNGSGLLDRLGKALEAPGPAKAEELEAVDKIEGAAAAAAAAAKAESSAINEGDIGQIAAKRDFAAMNGNRLDGWHTAAPSTMPVMDNDTKKARIDDHPLTTNSWGDEDLAKTELCTNGSGDAHVGRTEVILTREAESETNIQRQPNVEVEAHPILKSDMKIKMTTYDIDNSDSDIPEINTEPDTDEDDEEMYD
jgi:pre-rRNA-processing protein RIX1